MDLMHFFKTGGPIMWPLLIASIVALTVVIERVMFLVVDFFQRDSKVVTKILHQVDLGNMEEALKIAKASKDPCAKVLARGLVHDEETLSDALMHAASIELSKYERGLPILDTIITVSPLLGLLGTVTGMIHAFGLLGNQELGSPTAITGGIAEALIATAFGLGIAITALLPFNYLNTWMEKTQHLLESAATRLDLHVRRAKGYETSKL